MHIRLKLDALHVGEAINVREQEPSAARREEVVDHVRLWQAASSHHNRVDIVVGRTRTQFSLGQADCNRLKLGRNHQLASAGEHLQAGLILEVRADGDHAVQQRGFVQVNVSRRAVCNRATVNRVGRGAKSLTITTDRRIVGRGGVQHVGAVDFLGLLKGFNQAQVRRVELRLVQVVVDRLAGNSIPQGDFSVFLVVHKTLTSARVERSLTTFGLQLREAQIPHLGGTLEGHLRIVLGEHLVVLRRDHLILAFDTAKAGQEKILNGTKINSHGSCSLRDAGRASAVSAQPLVVEANHHPVIGRSRVGARATRRLRDHIGDHEREGDRGAQAVQVRTRNAGGGVTRANGKLSILTNRAAGEGAERATNVEGRAVALHHKAGVGVINHIRFNVAGRIRAGPVVAEHGALLRRGQILAAHKDAGQRGRAGGALGDVAIGSASDGHYGVAVIDCGGIASGNTAGSLSESRRAASPTLILPEAKRGIGISHGR